MGKKRIGLIGATGSIGLQAIDIISLHRDKFEVVYLTAHSNKELLDKLAIKTGAKYSLLTQGGMDELVELIHSENIDVALIGATGTEILYPVYELAKRGGMTLAIANKESIVAAGKLIMKAAKHSGTKIIPVDSEHSAIYQCLLGNRVEDVDKLILTASGGAFRDLSYADLKGVTVEQALKHPNWSMGRKITIDSATMMNKGLELVEANRLFGIPASQLDVAIHPQSIVHSMVSYVDGTVMAHMGEPDMRVPISYALNYPERVHTGVKALDFTRCLNLSFYSPDYDKYRCLKIAMELLAEDDTAKLIAMNASNEVAVNAFLNGDISFLNISEIIEESLSKFAYGEPTTISEVQELDKIARLVAVEVLNNIR